MNITYEAEVNEEIYMGLDVMRKAINEIIEQFGVEVTNSRLETPYEVDEE